MNHYYFLQFVMCDNFLYYMICFFLLSLVFAFIYLCLCLLFVFVFVLYSPYFRHWPNPTADVINLFCTTKKNTFLNYSTLPSFSFLSFVFIVAQLQVNEEQTDKHYTNIFFNLYKLYSLSLSISLFYIIQERESQT